jgi:putative ABC transport system permease protein
MESLLQDLRYACRMLVRNPGFTAVVVLTLALGIGANTAIFSVVNAVLLQPLPYPESDRLVTIREFKPSFGTMSVAWLNYVDWTDQNTTFEAIAAYQPGGSNLSGNLDPVWVETANVTANLFSVLGVQPLLGRTFLPEEDRPGGDRAVILSHSSWQQRFGGDPGAVSQTVLLDGVPFTVVGIMPAGFGFPDATTDLWASLGRYADQNNQRGNHPGITSIGRLRPRITLEQADAELDTIAGRLAEHYPKTNADHSVHLTPFYREYVGAAQPMLLVLLGAVGFVLLIACANVANLLLARGTSRNKEFAIRTALGAVRARLIRQSLTESVLLAMLGGALGMLAAAWGVDALLALLPGGLPRLEQVGIDSWVLSFVLTLSFLTGIVFGLPPAFHSTETDLHYSLKEGGRTSDSAGGHRLRSLLVVAEVALALVLLVGAGLMIRSFLLLQEKNPGFDPQNLLTMQISLPFPKYQEHSQRRTFVKEVLQGVEALPGVESAATVWPMPVNRNDIRWQGHFFTEDNPNPPSEKLPWSEEQVVTADYFRAMGIPLLEGRFFDDRDHTEAPPTIIVDNTFGEKLWPGESPLGRRIKMAFAGSEAPWLTIVGVVGHVKSNGVANESWAQMYRPAAQRPLPFVNLVVRAASRPLDLAAPVQQQVLAVDPSQPVYNISTMEELMADTVRTHRVSMLLLTIFAALALCLASVGIYGVISYSVRQRTHEMGVRMALGAQYRDILKMVVGEGMVLTLVGVGVGLAAALALTHVLSSLLFEVTPTDLLTFVAVAALLGAISLLACYIPARRATRVDPMVALRYE